MKRTTYIEVSYIDVICRILVFDQKKFWYNKLQNAILCSMFFHLITDILQLKVWYGVHLLKLDDRTNKTLFYAVSAFCSFIMRWRKRVSCLFWQWLSWKCWYFLLHILYLYFIQIWNLINELCYLIFLGSATW